MKLSLAILGGLSALSSAYQCGTKVNAEIEALHASLVAAESSGSGAHRRDQYRPPAGKATFEIPTFFHVITSGNQTIVGRNTTVTDNSTSEELDEFSSWLNKFDAGPKAVEKQLAVLNAAFAPAGFSFVLNETAFILAPEWRDLKDFSDDDLAMRTALRRGDYKTLNIWVTPIKLADDGFLTFGYATFPGRATKDATARDGVVLHPITMPGVESDNVLGYSNGMSLVHEVGHWLGLLHTFQAPLNASLAESTDPLAGCRGPGDYIYDTPAQGSRSTGCQIGQDTCTGKLEAENTRSMPGPDPIHNYMDYSSDVCRYEFTPMQVQRMTKMYVDVRINYVEGNFEGPFIDQELEEESEKKANFSRPVPRK